MNAIQQSDFTSAQSLVKLAASQAEDTDREGTYPRSVIDAFLETPLSGLLSASDIGGAGGTLRQASEVVAQLGAACGSTAMIVAMHYSAAAVIEALGTEEARRSIATGDALATLAFSEAGSRSHFWAPVSTAQVDGDEVVLDARKSWITSANHADLYVWSSRGTTGEGSSIWLVPGNSAGLDKSAAFDGMGLRGNDSAPVVAQGVRIPASNLLGEEGDGMNVMLGQALPAFAVLNSSAALGIMRGAIARTIEHAGVTRFEHLDQSISRFPTVRAYIARIQLQADMVAALLSQTLDALDNPGPETTLRVLEVKAAAGESATQVTDLAMRVCGGAAFRKDVGVERYFRDARANTVMAPTTDQLYDFIGRAVCGIDLFD